MRTERDSLPRSERGFQGVRRSTPWLNDEASVWYGEFGPFYTGLQFSPSELPKYLEGEVPALHPPE